jgi:hypothetical protein
MTTDEDIESLTRAAIKQHYRREEVKNIIRTFADYKGCHKAGKHDETGLYQYTKNKRRLLDFCSDEDYNFIIRNADRVLLSTLNHFDADLFSQWELKEDASPGGFAETEYFSLSVDIDLADDYTVNDAKALEALRTAGRFIYQKLSAVTDNKIMAMFSGNGVYIHLHPHLPYLGTGYSANEKEELYDVLTKAFNLYLQALEEGLYQEHPEVHGLVKIDAINNKKRYFKTILSLHRRLPYVVFPIDPEDDFQIPLKSIPLSEDDLQEAERLVHDFMTEEITKKARQDLLEVLKPCTEQIKINKREYKELDIKIPEEAIPIDIIKSEQVTAAIMHPDGWSKGNTRRAGYIAAMLNLCGWDNESVHEYIEGIAADWNVGALSHVIDSWIGMFPPSIPTIYQKGSGYPMMNFGDCNINLPDKPDYHSPLKEIFKKASAAGIDVPWQDEPEPDIFHTHPLEEEGPEPEPDPDIKLYYPTEHLNGYEDLVISTDLFGDEYKPIFKALWYQLMSFKIRTADLKMGRNKADGRINALYPLKAGHGKGELKRVIKYFIDYFELKYAEPTSLHAEQLCGKPVKKPRSEDFDFRMGYLARDWLVIDEAFNLLSSNELHYSEARKYIRTALDRYPGNTIHKETTEIGDAAALEYEPTCPISLFLQPKHFENDILVLEGDLRRVICPYVNMTGVNKTDAYKRNIFDEYDDEQAMYNFCQYVEGLSSFSQFRASTEVKVRFLELFFDLIEYGSQYNQKIRNFIDIIGYTLQTFLLKFSAIQALQHGRNQIQIPDVELAYMDLFEIMHHTYQYVNNKIPGFLNYGEGWQGAEAKDQEALNWLYEKGAINEDSAVKVGDYENQIMELFNVKIRRSREIIKNHVERGWIVRKRSSHSSKIWIGFEPESSIAVNCNLHRGDQSIANKDNSINSINYYLLYNNYYNILNSLQDNPTAKCKPLQSTTSDIDPTRSAHLQHNNTTSTHQGTHHQHDNIPDKPATITAATPTNGTTGRVTTEPTVNQNRIKKTTKKDRILQAAYDSLKFNERSGIYSVNFTDAISEAAEEEEFHDLFKIQLQLDREGFIRYDKKTRQITPTDKLLNRFNHQELVNM